MTKPHPLIVFSDDWGRHPSSCQHLIRHMLPHRPVTWINTIGTRPLRLDLATLQRGFGKLRSWYWPAPGTNTERKSPDAQLPRQPVVLSPKMWPSFRSRFGRKLNRKLLTSCLRSIADSGPAPIIVTTLPLLADLVGQVRAKCWVYYCVDDFSVWPGLDGRTLRDLEAEFVPKIDLAIAVGETLQAHLATLGKSSHLLTHGVDLEFWSHPIVGPLPASLKQIANLERPLIVFWGVIDRRTDENFVRHLSEHLDAGTILFVGPQQDPDAALLRLPRVTILPAIPYADLPALAALTDVFIAPYADLPVTRAMQPLKLKEYIATGKPVVVRKLPATAEWADCADVVDTPEAFTAAVLERLRVGVTGEQRKARQRIDGENWASKAAQFERWIDGVEAH